MSSNLLIPPKVHSASTESFSDPVTRWAATSQAFVDDRSSLNRKVDICRWALCAAGTLSWVSTGGLTIAACVFPKSMAIFYAWMSTGISGGGLFGGSMVMGKCHECNEKQLTEIKPYATIEGIVKLRFDLLSNPPKVSCPTYLAQMGVLSPETFARLEKLTLKLMQLNNENPCNDMPEEAVRANPVLSARLDRINSNTAKWVSKWVKFRPILDRELPNPQTELELNAAREELELFE